MKVLRKILLLLMIVFSGIMVALIAGQDGIIIEHGVRFYRTIRMIAAGLTGITAVLLVAAILLSVGKDKRAKRKEKETQKAVTEPKSEPAELPVSGRLTDYKIRNLLLENMQSPWGVLEEDLAGLLAQMREMDEDQEKLRTLLAHNQADMLKDTEELLDQVEQYICRNIRKVLNYMTIYDPKAPEDVKKLRGNIIDCREQNEEQLRQTKEFVVALTEFLNRQGDTDTESLEFYKNVILDSIKYT